MQHFGHPHSFQLTGLGLNQIESPFNPHVPDPRHQANLMYYDSRAHSAGSQIMPPGQLARGPMQHIHAPMNPHLPNPIHQGNLEVTGAQIMPPGQMPRGPMQHIHAPMNPHLPNPIHQGNLEVTGAQVMPPGQQARGPLQHIQAPFNPHAVDPRNRHRPHVAGAQLPKPGQQARGPHQHIAAPFNPHVPDARHQANLEYYDSRSHAAGAMTKDGRHIMTKLEYPRGEWRYQISGAGPLQSIVGAGTSIQDTIMSSPALMIGLSLAVGLVGGVILGPEIKKAI